MDWTLTIAILAAAVVTTFSAFAWIMRFEERQPRVQSVFQRPESQSGIVYIFEGRELLDATDRAIGLLAELPDNRDSWSRFLRAFSPRFPELEDRLHRSQAGAVIEMQEKPDDLESLTMRIEQRDGITRISLLDPGDTNRSEVVERYSLQAMQAELGTLRSIAENSPVLTWKQRTDGTVIWANGAYMSKAREEFGEEAMFSWPPAALFPELLQNTSTQNQEFRRISIQSQVTERNLWFDLVTYPMEDGILFFADPINKLVEAEDSLADFVQTLGKTFAHLPIGLAIFDRKRQLALFNPSLTDLTALPPTFLSSRPTLHAFLDALREIQRVPEPKDFKSWRLHIAQLEAAANEGTYEEIWSLPTGQTYRVSGRPHPDGAIAFLFEDISNEVSLTRSYRSELALGQAVLDNLDRSIAVFGADGSLTMSNDAFTQMWDLDPKSYLGQMSITDVVQKWTEICGQDEIWADVYAFALGGGGRAPIEKTLTLANGDQLEMRVRAMPRANTFIGFRKLSKAKAKSSRDTKSLS